MHQLAGDIQTDVLLQRCNQPAAVHTALACIHLTSSHADTARTQVQCTVPQQSSQCARNCAATSADIIHVVTRVTAAMYLLSQVIPDLCKAGAQGHDPDMDKGGTSLQML